MEHRAHIACYVEDLDTGVVYGVTNRHVAIHAESDISVKLDSQTVLHIGNPIIPKIKDGLDIALIEIRQDLKPLVCNQITDKNGRTRQLTLFKGDREMIYGLKVIKCTSYMLQHEIELQSGEASGRVQSKLSHENIFGNHTRQFCVENINEFFSEPGDSGKAVAIQNGSTGDYDRVEVIGVIVGGNESLTYCLFLPDVLSKLNEYYDKRFKLLMANAMMQQDYESADETVTAVAQNKPSLESCLAIYLLLKTPERIKECNFNLAEYVLTILNLDFGRNVVEGGKHLLERESGLKTVLNLRQKLSCTYDFECDLPEQQSLYQGLIAVENLHSGNFKIVEANLKMAMKRIPSCKKIVLHLFSANLTYVVWFYVLQHNKESRILAEQLLKEGIDFCLQYQLSPGFPKQTLGFFYYEMSRCQIQRYDDIRSNTFACDHSSVDDCFIKAIEFARKAVHVMEEVHIKEQTTESLIRLSYIQCELASALLKCGNNFDVRNETHIVSPGDLEEADRLVMHVKTVVVNSRCIQKHITKYVIYLVTRCDLEFRKGCYNNALKVARVGLDVATKKDDKFGMKRTKRRIEVLDFIGQHNKK